MDLKASPAAPCKCGTFKLKNTVTVVKHIDGSKQVTSCSEAVVASGTGTLHKVDGTRKKEDYLQILKHYL